MDRIQITYAILGGTLIGTAASGLLWVNGRIAGISGILAGALVDWLPWSARVRGEPRRNATRHALADSSPRRERLAFLLGLLAGGALLRVVHPEAFPLETSTPLLTAIVAGLLVGVGTALANGCTSGHGVCGIARLSRRSLVATATFMAVGALTVFLVEHIL